MIIDDEGQESWGSGFRGVMVGSEGGGGAQGGQGA